MSEFRRFHRVPHSAFLHVLDGESGEGLLHFETRILSSGGAYVETGFRLEVGMRFRIRCELAPGEVVDAEAEVMWVSDEPPTDEPGTGPGMGIRFTSLGVDDVRSIDEFVRAAAG